MFKPLSHSSLSPRKLSLVWFNPKRRYFVMAVFILITTAIHPPEIKMSKCSSRDNFLRANSRVENKKPMAVSIYFMTGKKQDIKKNTPRQRCIRKHFVICRSLLITEMTKFQWGGTVISFLSVFGWQDSFELNVNGSFLHI